MEELQAPDGVVALVGHRGARLVTPAEVKAMVPFIDEIGHPRRVLHAGRRRRRLAPGRHAHARARPGAGRADGRRRAPRSPGIDVEDGRVTPRPHRPGRHRGRRRRHRLRRLEPADRGDGRRVDPADAGGPPDDRHRAGAACSPTPSARSSYPIVRDMDTNMYERQHGSGFEVGSYAHRAILMDADDIPSIARVGAVADRAAVHPGGLRARRWSDALELVPGDRRRRVGRA